MSCVNLHVMAFMRTLLIIIVQVRSAVPYPEHLSPNTAEVRRNGATQDPDFTKYIATLRWLDLSEGCRGRAAEQGRGGKHS